MTLTKQGYRTRIIDQKIVNYLMIFGAVSIEGPKWCGKTWTSLNHANSVTYIMDPAGNYSNRERARINPTLVLEGNRPHVIDEWQEVAGIWDAVRFSVDQEAKPGKFILTGSVTPPRDSNRHSGVGRIALARMRPMSLFESGDSVGTVSLDGLFNGEIIEPFAADIELPDLIDLTIRGGWPQTLQLPINLASHISIEYLNTLERNELFNEDFSRRSPQKLKKLIRALARNNSTPVGISTLTTDVRELSQAEMTSDMVTVSRETANAYIDDLKKIFVIEELPGWSPQIRSKTRIRMAPKRVFVDPSLAIAALGIGRKHLLRDLRTYGFMFENLCLRDLAVYSESLGATLCHYRDNSGLEADAIIEMPDGSWSAIEIKLGEYQVDAAARSLIRLQKKMVEGGANPPVFLAVLIGGGLGYKREDGVYVIPINALAP
jgi:predicted AAA+ superfamily ATPase